MAREFYIVNNETKQFIYAGRGWSGFEVSHLFETTETLIERIMSETRYSKEKAKFAAGIVKILVGFSSSPDVCEIYDDTYRYPNDDYTEISDFYFIGQ